MLSTWIPVIPGLARWPRWGRLSRLACKLYPGEHYLHKSARMHTNESCTTSNSVSDVDGLYFHERFKGSGHPFYDKVYKKAAKIDKLLADNMVSIPAHIHYVIIIVSHLWLLYYYLFVPTWDTCIIK